LKELGVAASYGDDDDDDDDVVVITKQCSKLDIMLVKKSIFFNNTNFAL